MSSEQQMMDDLPENHPMRLVYHLHSCLVDQDDIHIDSYCDLWTSLCLFIRQWSFLLKFVTDDVTRKVNDIRAIREENKADTETFKKLTAWEDKEERMKKYKPKSGTVNVLVLHRAMDFVIGLIDDIYKMENNEMKVTSVAKAAYDRTLAQYHPWLVRGVVSTAFNALPTRKEFVRTMRGPMCEDDDEKFYSEFIKYAEMVKQRVADELKKYKMTHFTKYNE